MTNYKMKKIAMRIADRASEELLRSEGLGSSDRALYFNHDAWYQDEIIREAGEYLQARGRVSLLAYDNFTAVVFKDRI